MGICHIRFEMEGSLIILTGKNNENTYHYCSEMIQVHCLPIQSYNDCVRPPSTGKLIPLM